MKIKYLLLLLNSFYCFSQVVPTKLEATKKDLSFPTNPTMYDFTKYGNVPLNEYRGIANINIPLYNLSLDGVEIPLTLSYYSGGIKVAEEAGIVGLGWSLNLPTIIQNIKDEDDLKSSTKFQTLPGSTGGTVLPSVGGLNPDYWSPSYFSATSIIAPSCDPGASVGYNNLPQYFVSSGYFLIDKDGNYPCGSEFSEMTYNYVDTEPDVFSVNINGDNLIIIRDDIGLNTPGAIDNVTLPLKVINGHSGYKVDRTAEGIKITDYKGNQYFFGAVDSITSTVSSNGFLQGSDPANTIVSKIHRLSKIITHKNKEILFSYFNDTVKDLEKKSYVYYKNISTSTTSFQSGGSYNSAPEDVEGINQQTFNTNQASLNSFTTEKQTQTYSFLSSITTSEETVSLSYSNRIDYEGMRKLDNISVYNNKGDVVKAIDFGYTYFGNVSDYLNKRLKLNSVTFNSDTSYQFEYNSTELPAKDSFSIDYWGIITENQIPVFYPI
ncbi:hypothetical protein DI487_14145 [Flavobacterium sediminis]|uniref:Uncharacterized protein n=1 Tax=Flavobacterium sediminis TaxID=2201181 RepID=A0A2U8QXD1_9FLAO|nr:hypothetical protein [Flavobacterium sediminis]AWM14882.1 hypothetical protein DI487_14145 [Flavobacterium sediminis]